MNYKQKIPFGIEITIQTGLTKGDLIIKNEYSEISKFIISQHLFILSKCDNHDFYNNIYRFSIIKNIAEDIIRNPPDKIEIEISDIKYHYLFMTEEKADNMVKLVPSNSQKPEQKKSSNNGHIYQQQFVPNEKEKKSIYYPSRGVMQELTDLPKETPKIEVPNNISEINKLKVDNYKLAKEVKSLKESLEKVTQSKFGQNELVNSLKEEIQKLESEKRDIDYELSSIKRKYEEINKNYEDLEKISKTKDEQVYNLKSALSNYETENTLLKDELKKKIEELNKKNDTIETLENTKINLNNKISDLENQIKKQETNIRAQYSNLTPNTKEEVIMEFLYWYINNEEETLFSKIINYSDIKNHTQKYKNLLNKNISEEGIIFDSDLIKESINYIYELLQFSLDILKNGNSENEFNKVEIASNLGYYYSKIMKTT